jgi:hypothetical protein
MNFLLKIRESLEQGRLTAAFETNDASFEREQLLEEVRRQASIKVVIERNGEPWRYILLLRTGDVQSVGDVEPGAYVIRLSTGRVLWESDLTEQELLWEKAFPEQDLPMAADTGTASEHWTIRESLILEELELRVAPGLNAGRLTLELKGSP